MDTRHALTAPPLAIASLRFGRPCARQPLPCVEARGTARYAAEYDNVHYGKCALASSKG